MTPTGWGKMRRFYNLKKNTTGAAGAFRYLLF